MEPNGLKSEKSTAMKMAPRRLKINNLQSDLMQTPFSCKVERQRRMKSYRKLAHHAIAIDRGGIASFTL